MKSVLAWVNILIRRRIDLAILVLGAGFIVLFFSQSVASDVAPASSIKYISRLEKKQQSLIGIREDILRINESVNKRSSGQERNTDDKRDTGTQFTISKEILTEMIPNTSKMMVTSLPMQGANLLPESLFEEELEKENKRRE